MNRILAAVTPVHVAFLAVGLVIGVWSGSTAASTPVIKAPHQCTVALNAANRIFIAQTNVVSAVHARATRGQDEFAEHDAEVTRLLDELDTLAPIYNDAEVECLGLDR